MPIHIIYAISLPLVAAAGYIALFLGAKRLQEQHRNEMRTLVEGLKQQTSSESLQELSEYVVGLNRGLKTQETAVESLEATVTELRQLIERRYKQIYMRMYRDSQEEGGEPEEEPADDRQLLLQDLGQESPQAEHHAQSGRTRLVRKSSRNKYGR